MTSQNSKGVLLFAKNNPDFNYVKQATVAATMAKHYLGVPVALITPKDELVDDVSVFDYVIDWKSGVEHTINKRPFYINGEAKIITWHNLDRLTAYELSPFEETLLIDSDYLIQNDVLSQIWGSSCPMMMNTHNRKPDGPQHHVYERVIADGFPLVHWFTVMYFRRCEETELWFKTAKFVKDNYDFYKLTFRVPYHYYRNDMIAAIASHILGGFEDGYMKPLPVAQINSYAPEEILSIDHGSITLSTEKYPVLLKDRNIHLVNKLEIEKHYDKFMELYS
jgi:hypothetical protein